MNKTKKILLVDDEPELVEMVKMRLSSHGYEVVTAVDGAEALKKAKSINPDLIILDLMLPKMDGYQVCRILKFDDKYKRIPIILFTARAMDSDKVMGMEVGADAYLNKPFEPRVFMETIEKLLQNPYNSR
ncbi:MAG: response regulator [Candidatus Saganbacteria bacterium]|nr:response regulator [Candidatus Saganbacteria bacterium]